MFVRETSLVRQRYGIGRIFDSQICSRCGEYNQDPHQDYYVHKLIDELVERKEEIMGQQCINRDLEKRLENQEIIKLRIAKERDVLSTELQLLKKQFTQLQDKYEQQQNGYKATKVQLCTTQVALYELQTKRREKATVPGQVINEVTVASTSTEQGEPETEEHLAVNDLAREDPHHFGRTVYSGPARMRLNAINAALQFFGW